MRCLYVVATPIGHLADLSPRAIEVLKTVDYIAAEDTRHTKKLLNHFAIQTQMLPLHEHNEKQQAEKLIQLLENKSIALVSDAGTPLISDPGSLLIQRAHAEGIQVVPIPGCCAAIAALSVAGLPPGAFSFEGFLPVKKHARQETLNQLQSETRHLIFYEAPHRILETLAMMQVAFGDERQVVIAREITKKFETIKKDSLKSLNAWIKADDNQQKGEFVIIVEAAAQNQAQSISAEVDEMLQALCQVLPARKACELIAKLTPFKKNQLYDHWLKLGKL